MGKTRTGECLDCGQVRTHVGRGLCATCRSRRQVAGTLDQRPTRVTNLARVIAWLDLQEPSSEACWPWPYGKANGYGSCSDDDGRSTLVHRVSFTHFVGPIPDGFTVDHQCHNADPTCTVWDDCPHRACANPAHLDAVPGSVNTLRGHSFAGVNARKTHCSSNHPLTDMNVYVEPGTTKRRCQTCRRDAELRYRQRKAAS